MNKCIALTRQGNKCSNDAVDGTNYCAMAPHKAQSLSIKKENKWKWLGIINLYAKKIFTLIGIISILLAFTYFYPKVTVSPAVSLNPQDAMSTPFIISNEGNTPIINVEYLNEISVIQLASGGRMTGTGGGIFDPNQVVPRMEAGEKHTVIFPPQVILGPITYSDMAIVVRFKIPFLPFKVWKRVFRFITVKDVKGVLNWYPQPQSK